MKRLFTIALLLLCAPAALRAQWTFFGADSAEKVHSNLITPIPFAQTMSNAVPFKVAITLGDGAKFKRIPQPFILTAAPVSENQSTPIEEFIVGNVSNDTLYLTKRSLSNTTAHTWGTGSYIGYRLTAVQIKQLQDSLNWLRTSGPGSGTVTSITFQSPITGGTITSSGTVTLPQATSSMNGYLSSTDWATFNNKLSGITATAPLILSGSTLLIPKATASVSGYLSLVDWTTFNNKATYPDSAGKAGKVLTAVPGGGYDWTAAGSGTVTSANVLGGTSGLVFTGGPITSAGAITLSGGQLTIANGGTGASNAGGALFNLTPDSSGLTGKYLRIKFGGGYSWDTAVGGGSSGVTSVNGSGGSTGLTLTGGPITSTGTLTLGGTLAVTNGGTGQTSFTNGQILIGNSTGNTLTKTTLTAGTGISVTNGAGTITIANTNNDTGTVASVGISGPSIINWTNTPVTSTGTLTGTLASQSANLVLASPDGSSGVPTFRSLVPNDIPSLDASIITSGALAVARGGMPPGTDHQILQWVGTTPTAVDDITLSVNPGSSREITLAASTSNDGTALEMIGGSANGSNKNGGLVRAKVGLSTGNADPGAFEWYGAIPGSSGTSLQTWTLIGQLYNGASQVTLELGNSGSLTGNLSLQHIAGNSVTVIPASLPTTSRIDTLPDASGTIALTKETGGGTNQTSYAKGDLLYASASNTLSKLAVGAAHQSIASIGGVPAWVSSDTLPANAASTRSLSIAASSSAAGTELDLLGGDGNGPNVAGGDVSFYTGRPTGNHLPQQFNWYGTYAGSSGSSVQSYSPILVLYDGGAPHSSTLQLGGNPGGTAGQLEFTNATNTNTTFLVATAPVSGSKTLTLPDATGVLAMAFITGGGAATCGTGTLSGGSATVNTTAVQTSSIILITDQGGGIIGNIGSLYRDSITGGTSFTVKSTNALDNSNFSWIIINP